MTNLFLQVAERGSDWPEAFIAIGGITMVTAIVVVAIWQGLVSWRARMSVAREEAYRKLADESATKSSRLADQQEEVLESLKGISERLSGIERILREVG